MKLKKTSDMLSAPEFVLNTLHFTLNHKFLKIDTIHFCSRVQRIGTWCFQNPDLFDAVHNRFFFYFLDSKLFKYAYVEYGNYYD